ncbi:MAG TPA: glycosyltransferase family 1 protein [Vicinamibacterales bacterium]|nr:glycosyltransferase family 1 protein [Vicinamibacterales bacterium]
MRIGIDATCWANTRGYGRFTRELVEAMVTEGRGHEFVCFLDELSSAGFSLKAPNLSTIVVDQVKAPTIAASSGSRRSVRDMLRLTAAVRQARKDGLDAFLSPSVYGYFPLPPGLPAVVTIHDAIPERFPELTLPTWKDRLAWRAKVKLALRQAKLVLTVSEYAAREVAKYLRVSPDRLRVTLEGVSEVYRPSRSTAEVRAAADRARLPEGASWLMYVGGFGPHKHVDLVVRAHAEVMKRHPDRKLMLVLVGHHQDGFHSDVTGIRSVIKDCGTDHLVRWVGFLPDGEVRHLHSGALALVLPSASEGFGLPAVEAARCGTPVIATTESPLPEILEGGGIFLKPGDVGSLVEAIERMWADEAGRKAMGAKALERASALSWPRAGRVALAALEEVAGAAEKVESNAHART